MEHDDVRIDIAIARFEAGLAELYDGGGCPIHDLPEHERRLAELFAQFDRAIEGLTDN